MAVSANDLNDYSWDDIIKACKHALMNNMQAVSVNVGGKAINYRGTDEILRALKMAQQMKLEDSGEDGGFAFLQAD